MKRDRTLRAFSPLAAALVSTAPLAAAAAGDPEILQDIVVTAQRFAERSQDVPIAMSVLSAESLEARGAEGIDALQNVAPNTRLVASSGGSGSSAHIFIRGVGQRDYDITQEAQVPVYVDGVYLARTTGSLLNFMDLEQVEVLRGPQGTLFGRNAVGGAIQIVSARPSDEYSGRVRATIGRFDRLDVEGVGNIPLSDTLRLRVSGASLNRDGYAKLVPTGREVNDQQELAGRAQLLWKPSEQLESTLRFDYTSRDTNGGLQNLFAVNDPAAPQLVAANAQHAALGLPLVDAALIPTDPFRGLSYFEFPEETDIWGGSLHVSYDFGSVTLTSISAYRGLDSVFAMDYDGTQYALMENRTSNDQHQVSQELQLQGAARDEWLKWIAGVYYFKENVVQAQEFVGAPPQIVRTGPGIYDFEYVPNTGFPFSYEGDQTTRSIAAYAQATFRLAEGLNVALGVRGTRDEKDYDSFVLNSVGPTYIRPPGRVSESWNDTSPRFAIDYRISPRVMLYASAAKGFQSGGFNGRVYAPRAPESFDPQEMWAYQAGVKTDLLDRRLRLNASAFFYDYQNYQGLSIIPGTINLVVSNIAAVELTGGEIEADFRASSGFSMNASIAYLHSAIKDIVPGGAVTIQENFHLPEAPEWTLQIGAQQAIALGEWGALTIRADASYVDDTQFRLGITPTEREEGYALANARLILTPSSERWSADFFVTNLFDKEYRTYAQYSSGVGVTTAVWGRPLEWGLSVKARF